MATVQRVKLSPPDAKVASTAVSQRADTHVRTSPAAAVGASHVVPEISGELQRTRRQLEDLQRRYECEKRAQLQERTRQLRQEAHQRESEESVVEQAAQLLHDYEALLRFRDVASAEHLDAVLQRVAQDWQRSAQALEQTREECERSALQKVEVVCQEQQAKLQAALQQHLLTTAQTSVDAEARQFEHIATAVQEQVKSFKAEYRALVEQDMETRSRLMEEQAARREQQWVIFLREEHARVVAAGEVAAREASRRQLETLRVALRDVTQLRGTLITQQAERQVQISKDYVAAYEAAAHEYAVAAQDSANFVLQVQQACATVMRSLHAEAQRAQGEKHRAERHLQQVETEKDVAIAQERQAAEAQAEKHWTARMADERQQHRAALAALVLQHEEAAQELHRARDARVAEEARRYAAEIATLQEKLCRVRCEYETRAKEASDALSAEASRIATAKDAAVLEVAALTAQLRDERANHAVALLAARREYEAHFEEKLGELDTQYAAALKQHEERTTALATLQAQQGGGGGSGVSHVLRRVAELEDELHTVQQRHTAALHDAVDEAARMWSVRLQAAEQHHSEERDALAAQHRDLREKLLAEVRQREDDAERRVAAQREAHQQELHNALLTERQTAQRIAATREHEHADELAHVTADTAARVRLREDAVKAREEALAAATAAWQRARVAERGEVLQQLLEEVNQNCAEQQQRLQEREDALQAAQKAFAQQRREADVEVRAAAQREAAEHFALELQKAQQTWVEFLGTALQERSLVWQQARQQELDAVNALHREEVRQLCDCYTQQLQGLRDEQSRCRKQLEEEMTAREAAWTEARAASLESYAEAAAERLHRVAEGEKQKWDVVQREQLSVAAAAHLHAVAERTERVLAATDEERRRMESELRDVYSAVIEEHEVATATRLTEIRAEHEHHVAELRQECDRRLREQARRLHAEYTAHVKRHEEDRKKSAQSYEAQLAAMRAEQVEQLAQQRTAAHKALAATQQEAHDAQQAHNTTLEKEQREAAAAHRRRIDALQQQCDAQAAELLRHEAQMSAQVQEVREAAQTELRREYEQSMSELRLALEERNRAFATLQASLYEQVRVEVAKIQKASAEAYADFAKKQQQSTAERIAAHEAELVQERQRQQEQLTRLQQQHEAALTAQATKLRAEHAKAQTELTTVYDAQQTEWQYMLDAARADVAAAEATIASLTAQLAQAQVAQAEQHAAAYEKLDKAYRHVLEAAMAQVQEEREEVARQAVADAEQRFVASLLRHDHSIREASSPLPATATAADGGVDAAAAAVFPTPHARRTAELTGRGVTTPAAPRTPRPFVVSPPPLSPAGPMELVDVPAATTLSLHHPSSAASQFPPPQHAIASHEQEKRSYDRLVQLWDVLEVPLAERHAFLDHVSELDGAPEAQQRAWAAEQARREAQLPLLEALTRRDYVARQLRTLPPSPELVAGGGGVSSPLSAKAVNSTLSCGREKDSGSGSPPQLQQSSKSLSRRASATADAAQVHERLAVELERLTTQLRRDVTAHEAHFGQLFHYNGRRVMETL